MKFNQDWIVIIFVLVSMMGCCADATKKGTYMQNYYKALKDTDPQTVASLRQGSEEEKKAIAQFKEFYRIFSAEKIQSSIRILYAEKAYFRDGFREVQGIENIEKYFLSSTGSFLECTFDIQDVAVQKGNYYFRWIMTLVLNRDKDDRFQTAGMSHVRFDHTGKIIFHQDYWDTSVIYEKAPILGSIITWIRQRI